MKTKEIFNFGSQPLSSTIQAHPIGLKKDASGKDAQWNLLEGNYECIELPVVFEQEYGRKFYDVLNTGWASLYLISEKFKTILEGSKLTGWKVYPIKLFDKKGNEIAGYHGFSVTGRCKSTSFAKSEIIEKQWVESGPICKYYRGILIDGWDGSDFFSPHEEAGIFVTKNAADALKTNKLTNVYLKNLADIEIDIRDVK